MTLASSSGRPIRFHRRGGDDLGLAVRRQHVGHLRVNEPWGDAIDADVVSRRRLRRSGAQVP